MPTISLYIKDDVLEQVDDAVEKQAALDRSRGLSGRAITTRSSFIESLIRESLANQKALTVPDIEYYVISLAKEYGAEKVSLIGSFARGEERPDSDVDILLEKGEIKGMQVLEFQDRLELELHRRVDVVTTAGASPRFLERVKKDEVVLYEAS